MKSRVRVNLAPKKRFQARVVQEMRLMNGWHGQRVVKAWADAYFAFQRREFERNAKGGGDWPPLAPSTLARTPNRKGILWVLGIIHRALTPGAPGNIIEKISRGRDVSVRMGVGGSRPHVGGITIGRLVAIHHHGGGNVPARPIIRPVNDYTKRQMHDAVRRILKPTVKGWR